jgi:hypothetical protein
MNQFKIRASASGMLLTNGRGKDAGMGETAKSYIKQWLIEQKFGYSKEIKSKYLTKGLMYEDMAMNFYSEHNGLFLLKNQDTFENDFMRGTPDCVSDGVVYDFKTCWDEFTMPFFDKEPDSGYYAQLQTYMELTGVRKAKLIYTLLETPEELLKPWEEVKDYSHVDVKHRIVEFDINYDEEMVTKLKNRVVEARDYIKEVSVWQ